MESHILIGRLCDDLRPTAPAEAARSLRRALLTGLAITSVFVILVLGARADLRQAVATPVFWIKLGAMTWFGIGAWLISRRLGIPGSPPPAWTPTLLPPLVLLSSVALVQHAGGATGASFWLGASWRRCSVTIALLALPPLLLMLRALGRLAPVHRRRTGQAAGIAAGGMSAALYSLSCGETSAGFVLLWYGLGIATPALAGWALAPRLLRW